jgi:SnoaL-like domain
MPDPPNAARRFRDAVDRRDVAGMIETMATDVELHSPTTLAPVKGRDRVHRVFLILAEIFEDFEYVRTFDGALVSADPDIVSSHALMFRCRIADEQLEGVDILDINRTDQIMGFTVLIRPSSGLQALADSIAERMRLGPPPS